MPAKLLKLDPERRDPNRTYGVPAEHRQRVIFIKDRQESALTKLAKAQASSNRILWMMMGMLIALVLMVSFIIYQMPDRPAVQRPVRETPTIQTLRRHIRGVIFYIDKTVKNGYDIC